MSNGAVRAQPTPARERAAHVERSRTPSAHVARTRATARAPTTV